MLQAQKNEMPFNAHLFHPVHGKTFFIRPQDKTGWWRESASFTLIGMHHRAMTNYMVRIRYVLYRLLAHVYYPMRFVFIQVTKNSSVLDGSNFPLIFSDSSCRVA